jgi:hypothetical protein
MRGKTVIRAMLVVGMAAAAGLSSAVQAEERLEAATAPVVVPATRVTDYLHAIIEADRMFYTVHIVERMQRTGSMTSSEHWREENALPLPAQFLRESSALGAEIGSPVRYRLIARWPINPDNAPKTDIEERGLEDTRLHSDRPYTGIVMQDQQRWFTAVYADLAISQACVACHNAHPKSRKKDFKIGDVMGAIVISIPAE